MALYGGSFNPPHVAHGLVAAWALSSGLVDEVLVVPAFSHAFGKELAPYEHRFAMCERAFAWLPAVRLSRIEEELGESRTYRTLVALQSRNPDATYRLLIGADILPERHRWFRWDDIEAMAPPLIVGRVGHDSQAPLALPDVSSTELRDRFARGEATTGLVHPEVQRYVRKHGLYGASCKS
ncbi:MAG: nicotinate-nicotinamide nucleotide adenylyltransferase [Myxococcota bacterium]